MNFLSIAAIVAVTSVPIARVPAPITASRAAVTQMQNQNRNFYHPPVRRDTQIEESTCRLRAFFGSGVAKPLETVYFARPGSPCAGVPLYGFVFLTR